MLTMVTEKPMQLTIVSAVPLSSGDAFCATNVEKRGESAITTAPQKRRKAINKLSKLTSKIHGEIRQHIHDRSSAMNAVRFVPTILAIYPARTQANPPIAMIRKDQTGILNPV